MIIKFKKYGTWIFLTFSVLFLIALFAMRGTFSKYVEKLAKSQEAGFVADSVSLVLVNNFNYAKNGKSYKISFLEFGAKGCSACRKMEEVMSNVKQKFPGKVNVVFYNILKPENQVYVQHFGIAQIPTQILLNEQGVEFFRHTGFISDEDLIKEFQKNGLQ